MTETTEPQKTPPKNQRRTTWALAAGAALIGLAALVYVVSRPDSKPSVAAGEALPPPLLERMAEPPAQPSRAIYDAAGRARALADWRGKPLVVNFWATWCAPCVKEMPTLAALAAGVRAKGGEVIVISIDKPEKLALAKRKLAELSKGRLAFHAEPTLTIPFELGAEGVPLTVIYDAQGREVARVAGEADWSGAATRKSVLEAMGL